MTKKNSQLTSQTPTSQVNYTGYFIDPASSRRLIGRIKVDALARLTRLPPHLQTWYMVASICQPTSLNYRFIRI
jgi:hypothetical protein